MASDHQHWPNLVHTSLHSSAVHTAWAWRLIDGSLPAKVWHFFYCGFCCHSWRNVIVSWFTFQHQALSSTSNITAGCKQSSKLAQPQYYRTQFHQCEFVFPTAAVTKSCERDDQFHADSCWIMDFLPSLFSPIWNQVEIAQGFLLNSSYRVHAQD